jgi:hypothetical protein
MVRVFLLLIGLLAVAIPAQAGERVSIDGYFKSFIVGLVQPEVTLVDGTTIDDNLWANNNRVRGNIGVTLSKWLSFDGSYDLSLRIQDDDLFLTDPFVAFSQIPTYRVADLEGRIWPDDPGKGDHVAFFQNLDRLYLTASSEKFDLIIGRQIIAWGSGHAINPTDIITPFLYTEIDMEDRVGIDAARLRIPVGLLGEIDAGYVAGEDFKWEQSAAFMRGKFYAWRNDIALLVMAFRENILCGFDITRAIGGAGTWCEAAYVWADAANDRDSHDGELDYLRLSVGADYNFTVGSGLYSFLEYHYNGAGSSESRDYALNVVQNSAAYTEGSVYLMGRHYLVPGVSYQLTALTSFFIEALVSLSDGSVILTPYVEYNIAEDAYLSAGGYGAFGDNPTMQGSMGDDGPSGLNLNSEFGSYPNQFYIFLRYYF